MIRATIVCSGLVQGVGLRYNLRSLAHACGIKGQVRNMEDDTVEMTCEGERAQVEDMLERIRGLEFPIIITNMGVNYSEATGEFTGFKIIVGDMLHELVDGFEMWTAYMDKWLGNRIRP